MDTIKLVIDGTVVNVTNLFDEFGEEVESWGEAHRFVAGPLGDGTWIAEWCEKYVVRRAQ